MTQFEVDELVSYSGNRESIADNFQRLLARRTKKGFVLHSWQHTMAVLDADGEHEVRQVIVAVFSKHAPTSAPQEGM